MKLIIGKKVFAVVSLADASVRYQRFRGTKSRTRVSEGVVTDEQGVVIATVSYNGRVWPPGMWKPGVNPILQATNTNS